MSIQSAASIIDTYGLDSFSLDLIVSVFKNQGVFSSSKESVDATAKFVNRILSAAEQNGGSSVSACCSILRIILEQDSVSHLEKCVVHMLDFAKSAVLFFPDFGTKNDALVMMRMVFQNLKSLPNQFVRDLLPKLKELVYFHLDVFKKESLLPVFLPALQSLAALIRALQSSIKPILPNIESTLYLLMDNPSADIRRGVCMVIAALTTCDKGDDLWKQTLSKCIASLRYDFAEIVSMVDTSFSAVPRLQLPSLTVYGAITPARALARLSTLLQLIQELLHNPPTPVSIPVLPLYTVLLSLIEAYVPSGRRSEEASINGIALSPHDQWLLLPSLYPVALQTLQFTIARLRCYSFVAAQPLTRALRLFFLRCYTEDSLEVTQACLTTMRQLLLTLGPSALAMMTDVFPAVLRLLRCMNTSRDTVTLAAAGKKPGKAGRRKPARAQLGKPGEVPTQTVEALEWAQRPGAWRVFEATLAWVAAAVANARFVAESARLELELELFAAVAQLMAPSAVHRSRHGACCDPALREALLAAVRACCSAPLPSGQGSPLLALLPAVLEMQRVCEEGAARLGTAVASGTLGLVQHAPCVALFRPVRNVIDVTVNEERVVPSGESMMPSGEPMIPSGEPMIPSGEPMMSSNEPMMPSNEVVTASDVVASEATVSVEKNRDSVKRIGIPVLPVNETKTQETAETVPVMTGETEKRVKLSEVHQEIEHLRKLSQDFVEMERKKSVELLNQVIPAASTNDGFAFSDDNSDDFDVPDAPI